VSGLRTFKSKKPKNLKPKKTLKLTKQPRVSSPGPHTYQRRLSKYETQ